MTRGLYFYGAPRPPMSTILLAEVISPANIYNNKMQNHESIMQVFLVFLAFILNIPYICSMNLNHRSYNGKE